MEFENYYNHFITNIVKIKHGEVSNIISAVQLTLNEVISFFFFFPFFWLL